VDEDHFGCVTLKPSEHGVIVGGGLRDWLAGIPMLDDVVTRFCPNQIALDDDALDAVDVQTGRSSDRESVTSRNRTSLACRQEFPDWRINLSHVCWASSRMKETIGFRYSLRAGKRLRAPRNQREHV